MSLGSALNASVSGLQAQSTALAAVSENIANASTTAYKKREVSFESLVASSGAATSSKQPGGGVLFDTKQAVTEQGLIQNTGVSTNIAINGQGFFVVTDDETNRPSGYTYTRNGDFSTNEDGLLINNEGMILLGQRTNELGIVTAENAADLNWLEPVDLDAISGTAGQTTEVEADINLPADAEIWTAPGSDEYVTAIEVFDALGTSLTIEQTYRKVDPNTWIVEYRDPYLTGDTTFTPVGTIDLDPANGAVERSIQITFNGDGSINEITPGNWDPGVPGLGPGATPLFTATPFNVTITGLPLSTGANDLAFQLDLGTQNQFNGLTQFASNSNPPGIEIDSINQDGVRFGQFAGVEIDSNGIVTALFDNGVRRPIFQIPIATFPNPEGLTNVRGTVYDENENAGNFNLRLPSEGNAGNLEATSLELSTVDTSEEFNKMIVAQQNYSSAAQVLSTVDEMFDTLIGAVR
jgi:flagellar hook protein FlgE